MEGDVGNVNGEICEGGNVMWMAMEVFVDGALYRN